VRNPVYRPSVDDGSNERSDCRNVYCEREDLPCVLRGAAPCSCRPDVVCLGIPARHGYSLLWVQNGRVRSQGVAVIELLQNADAKGLDPEDYDGSRWQGRLLKLWQKPSEQDLVSFDTALTVSTMRYIRAIYCGRVYGTATVNEENQIRFFDDIYGYDAELEKRLAAEHP
jgi:murein L,D-transpeptidase YcbB/YkuD